MKDETLEPMLETIQQCYTIDDNFTWQMKPLKQSTWAVDIYDKQITVHVLDVLEEEKEANFK